jgi:hypothetical protein
MKVEKWLHVMVDAIRAAALIISIIIFYRQQGTFWIGFVLKGIASRHFTSQ